MKQSAKTVILHIQAIIAALQDIGNSVVSISEDVASTVAEELAVAFGKVSVVQTDFQIQCSLSAHTTTQSFLSLQRKKNELETQLNLFSSELQNFGLCIEAAENAKPATILKTIGKYANILNMFA